jgi:hypothetical protein
MKMKQIIALVSVVLSCAAVSAAIPDEEAKINALIGYIESHKEFTFIRNGSEYSAKDAAEHLRSKRASAGSRVKTAGEFIEYVASKSYLSGKPYLIKFPGGKVRPSGEVLKEELAKIEKKSGK